MIADTGKDGSIRGTLEEPRRAPAVVLAIGGLDPSAGAGILADIKTISFFGCYGIAVPTSLTVQNTTGISGTEDVTPELIARQLAALFDDFDVTAIKTGMLPTPRTVETVASVLSSVEPFVLVVDPVLRSTSGFDLGIASIETFRRRLFPLADLVTPNAAEAELITGTKITGLEAMETAARQIREMGPRGVLIKGGDLPGREVADLLLDDDGGVAVLRSKRLEGRNTHGTGCTMASAIAALLAADAVNVPGKRDKGDCGSAGRKERRRGLRETVLQAKHYIEQAITTAPGLGRGYGPLNHFPPVGRD